MNLEKLTPAPWEVEEIDRPFDNGPIMAILTHEDETKYDPRMGCCVETIGMFVCEGEEMSWKAHADSKAVANAKFAALARNAFAAWMENTNWSVFEKDGKWICDPKGEIFFTETDPFSALVAAHKWYNEQARTSDVNT